MASSFFKYFVGPRIYCHKDNNDVNGWILGTVESLFGRGTTKSFLGFVICLLSFSPQYILPASKFYLGTLLLLFATRGFLRYNNKYYKEFVHLLGKLDTKPIIKSYKQLLEIDEFVKLQSFDFAISHVPCQHITIHTQRESKDSLSFVKAFIFYLLNRFISKNITFPGSCTLATIMLSSMMKSSRRQLCGKEFFRMVLDVGDGLKIDTMFVDRRKSRINSEYLVITCEGNFSFYETGVFRQVLSGVNHSVLGWNYPGFSESKGYPFSENVRSSIIAVMKYAIDFLLFPADKIVIVGWSIGGFSAICAGCEFPEIKGIILDASFTNTIVFARNFFPLFRNQIEQFYPVYFNLNNDELLRKYDGRILVIARTRDNIMQLSPVVDGIKDWNRKYNLSFKLALNTLTHRYPYIFTEESVSVLNNSVNSWPVDINIQTMNETRKLFFDEEKDRTTFPSDLGSTMNEVDRLRTAKNLVDSMLYWHPGEHQAAVPYSQFIDVITDIH